MIHVMKLKEEYFDYILKGSKEYEIRLNDEKRSVIKKSDFDLLMKSLPDKGDYPN